ncbi:MAG: Rpn family recombination-promoting nuclease/putative transposase [Coleofasciculus sp. C3-bin4]|nr:Rpn family recombination-promoting nuclease/putative transposase [Coleofasciculus sp. C3-bin4]
MRTDTIFYQVFQTFPSLLFELIGQSPTEAQGYNFSSREIKELAFRFDGVFLPTTDSFNQPIYFLEVQFQSKSDFYWRLFTEIFLYLGQCKPNNDWRAVAVFASRSLDPGVPRQYRGLVMSQQVQFVYLDELGETADPSLGFGMVQLVVAAEETAVERTNRLMQQAQQELEDVALKRKVLELIETILVYKFTNLSRQELEAMFGLDELKQTRYFREVAEEAKLEGKLESVPRLLQLGLSVEQIAAALELDVEVVRQAAQVSAADSPQDEGIGI